MPQPQLPPEEVWRTYEEQLAHEMLFPEKLVLKTNVWAISTPASAESLWYKEFLRNKKLRERRDRG